MPVLPAVSAIANSGWGRGRGTGRSQGLDPVDALVVSGGAQLQLRALLEPYNEAVSDQRLRSFVRDVDVYMCA